MRASFTRRVETRRLITSNRNRGSEVSSDLARRILQSYTSGCGCERMYLLMHTLHINPLTRIRALINTNYGTEVLARKIIPRLCLVLNALLNN